MARDEHDQQTRSLPLQRRGRPPAGDTAMTAAERKAAERQRRRERGEVCMWLSAEEAAMVLQMRSSDAEYDDPPEHDDLRTGEGGSTVDLNFKVDSAFKRDFKLYAAAHSITQKEVLIRAFELLKRQQ